MKKANEKVWADADNNLVSDGDPTAVVLVAGQDQEVPDSWASVYPNFDTFFTAVTPPPEPEGGTPPHVPVEEPGSSNVGVEEGEEEGEERAEEGENGEGNGEEADEHGQKEKRTVHKIGKPAKKKK